MGYLIEAWKMSQKKFHMSMKQVVATAGDGSLDNDESIQELRDFYSLIDLETMKRLLEQCISKDKKYKFDTRGFAFQDLVNEMGKRLGYSVENGLYRGKKNEVGFDGLWTAKDESCIIMESKTSDDYSMSMESVVGYRDKLIIEHKIPKKKCSILVIYGRDEKGALRNTVKGSDDSKNIRLISANALYQLVKIYCKDGLSDSDKLIVEKQINNLLVPRDYFVLDNLVELVFPQTDDEIDAVEDTDEEKEDAGSSASGKTMTSDKVPDGIPVFCKGSTADGKGIFTDGKITVLKESVISDNTSPSYPKSLKMKRQLLCDEGTIVDGVFQKNWDAPSVSTAAKIILGRSANGWTSWKKEDGSDIEDLRKK